MLTLIFNKIEFQPFDKIEILRKCLSQAHGAACKYKFFGDELWMEMVDVLFLHPVYVKHCQANAKCMRDSSPFSFTSQGRLIVTTKCGIDN